MVETFFENYEHPNIGQAAFEAVFDRKSVSIDENEKKIIIDIVCRRGVFVGVDDESFQKANSRTFLEAMLQTVMLWPKEMRAFIDQNLRLGKVQADLGTYMMRISTVLCLAKVGAPRRKTLY